VLFRSGKSYGDLRVFENINLTIPNREIITIVGPSGCGKTTLLRCIDGLIPLTDGHVEVNGNKITSPPADMAMVFQHFGLFPWKTVVDNVAYGLKLAGVKRAEAKERAMTFIQLVGLTGFENNYPHELSGGMRQRAMIAMALSTKPKLLIADEPTTALDVTIQAQVIDLMKDLVTEFGMGIVFITHDLGVIAQTADSVAVMYLGRLVEQGSVRDVIRRPAHPYTQGLLAALPSLDDLDTPLKPIPGDIPSPLERPPGCVFNTRCAQVVGDVCSRDIPQFSNVSESHQAACHLYTQNQNEGAA